MQQVQSTPYSNSLAKSLTIDEMRDLYKRAISDAEAKKTELKLVLASRYKELVGSSDEVLEMQRDAKLLDELVNKIPGLVEELLNASIEKPAENKEDEDSVEMHSSEIDKVDVDRIILSQAPRAVHSCLDESDVYGASKALLQIFSIMTKYTREYPLANALSKVTENNDFSPSSNKELLMQIQMVYMHLQSIPIRIVHISKKKLLQLSTSASDIARALTAIHLLNVQQFNDTTKANRLLDLYFDSKAKHIHRLMDKLTPKSPVDKSQARSKKDSTFYSEEATNEAEKTISEILMILQYDVILYPYQIFALRTYEMEDREINITSFLPTFDHEQLKSKISNFLAANLPLIRSKVKTILVGIAGTTASRLGHLRQSLYDKTDGADCLQKLSSGVCKWEDAIKMIDVKVVTRALEGLTTTSSSQTTAASLNSQQKGFSLWGTLFSNTFSSLVHSILSTSFHSVHRQVVSSLRASLANAPPFNEILPHEAYRNTLKIATELDQALKKVSDDAHELLVHAEEREESERRLKQSLYVQTCEIMGRLLNELRRMLKKTSSSPALHTDSEEDATRDLILGRLCFLLKFRLTSLPILLDPNSSPAIIASKSRGKVGMISIVELQSAFEIADVDDDGLITFEEAMEAMEGAFSGTHFHGAEMVRETMLLSSGVDMIDKKSSATARTLSLSELALLSARGLKHAPSGNESALGTIQGILDGIVETCFEKWAKVALSQSAKVFSESLGQFISVASSVGDVEWKRLYLPDSSSEDDLLQQEIGDALGEIGDSKSDTGSNDLIGNVSSFVISYFISVASTLNRSISPSDAMQPYPSEDYANAMGLDLSRTIDASTMLEILRSSLVRESLLVISKAIQNLSSNDDTVSELVILKCPPSAQVQLLMDISFIEKSYFKRNSYDFGGDSVINGQDEKEIDESFDQITYNQFAEESLSEFIALIKKNDISLYTSYIKMIETRHDNVYASCNMFFSSLFGDDETQPSDLGSVLPDSVPSEAVPLLLNPMSSSRRFMLLPIQAEQSVKELELIKNLGKERSDKNESEKKSASSAAASAVSSSFGFFSSMLNKKK